MGIFNILRRKKVDGEDARRAQLLRAGRITEGTIFDVATDEAGTIRQIFFSYSISGVEYESSQALDQDQHLRQSDYVPGSRIVVRFQPQQPGNAVVV